MVTFSSAALGSETAVEASHELLDWLAAASTNPSIRGLDPYGDTRLSEPLLSSWLDSVTPLLEGRRAAAVARLAHGARLPRNEAVRSQVLGALLERERKRDRILDQLTRLVELLEGARLAGSSVDVAGD